MRRCSRREECIATMPSPFSHPPVTQFGGFHGTTPYTMFQSMPLVMLHHLLKPFLRKGPCHSVVAGKLPRLVAGCLLGVLFGALWPSMPAGGATASSLSASRANQVTVALIMKSLSNPFFYRMQQGAKAEAARQRVHLEVFGLQHETEISRQINIMENCISRGFTAIILCPADSVSLAASCRKAMQAGITIVTADNPLDAGVSERMGIAPPFVGPDNVEGSELVARYALESIGGVGTAMVLGGIPGAVNAEKRMEGFMNVLARFPGVRLVAQATANWHEEEAFTVMSGLLAKHGPPDVVLSANDSMALGALLALEMQDSLGATRITGYDNIEAVQREILAGRILATVEQRPDIMGAKAVELVVQIANGATPPQVVRTPVSLITRDQLPGASQE